MDNYSEVKEATTNKVRFSITPEGKIEFDAQGLSEWEAEAVIDRVATQAREQRKATQRIKEVAVTGDIVMHSLAVAFLVVVVTGTSFTLSRVLSTAVNQPRGVTENVR